MRVSNMSLYTPTQMTTMPVGVGCRRQHKFTDCPDSCTMAMAIPITQRNRQVSSVIRNIPCQGIASPLTRKY